MRDGATLEAGLLVFYFLLGFCVGGIKACRRRNSKSPFKIVLADAAACGATSFFVGLFLLHYDVAQSKPYLAAAGVTLSGWIGPVILEHAADKFLGKLKGEE
jgi:hypothetical protein